jgi:DNA-binding NarL/FixJ family response regulator
MTRGENGTEVAVLTVDDQRVFREAAHDVIEATAGFTSIGEASSGAEALAVLEERHPALVLVDVRMPDMDGIELSRLIKRAHPDLIVVLISIEDTSDLGASASSSGAEALVCKRDFGPKLLRGLWRAHGS